MRLSFSSRATSIKRRTSSVPNPCFCALSLTSTATLLSIAGFALSLKNTFAEILQHLGHGTGQQLAERAETAVRHDIEKTFELRQRLCSIAERISFPCLSSCLGRTLPKRVFAVTLSCDLGHCSLPELLVKASEWGAQS